MSSNLPPGCNAYNRDDEVKQKCKNGHVWWARMFYELGGWFYYKDGDAYCPQCGEEALEAES